MKNTMKKILLTGLLISGFSIFAQTPVVSPEVINSAGDHRQLGATDIYITDNVGEPFTEMLGPTNGLIITQGFIQPETVSKTGFSVTVKVVNVTCFDKNDGEIIVTVEKAVQAVNYEVTYNWLPAGTCNSSRCDSIGGLQAQTYTLNMAITYTNVVGSVLTDTLQRIIPLEGSNELCKIKIYKGITANGDGINDVLTIDNIEEFPNSHIIIFNRWGKQMADIKGYNNTTNPWPTQDNLDNLTPSTYFYILDLGDGSKQIKGWIELIKN